MDLSAYARCRLCPWECGAARAAGPPGRCGAGPEPRVGRAAPHFWEEPCLSGTRGSGTVFFTGCPLRCVYCQNQLLRRPESGKPVSVGRLAGIFLELQAQGVHNLNLVTPGHHTPFLLAALEKARQNGLALPIVWNSGGWERVETVRMARDYADVWLSDFKYWDDALGERYSGVPRYREIAQAALDAMVGQTGPPRFDEDGLLLRGVIVRHLMLPGHLRDTKAVLRYLAEAYGGRIWISLMSQYTPGFVPACRAGEFPELQRRVTAEEYDAAVDFAWELGLENVFLQEGESASESFVPAFDGEGV